MPDNLPVYYSVEVSVLLVGSYFQAYCVYFVY